MPARRPEDRALIASIAAHASWARTTDPGARTANARRAFTDRFERQVDPDGTLPPAARPPRRARPQGVLQGVGAQVGPGPPQDPQGHRGCRRVTPNEQAPAEWQLDEGQGITVGGGSAARFSPSRRRDQATGATTSRPFRPLAGKYVDLIHDGVPDLGDTHGREYDTAVWDALVRTALAAGWAGHTYYQWATNVDRGRLGRQAETQANRKMRPKPNVNRLLWKAWDRAQQRISEGRWTTEDRANLIAAVRDFAADATVVLKGNRRAVLAAVAALADKHQHTRPACPLHELEALTGLTRKQVRTALTQLQADGLLTLARRGRGGMTRPSGGPASTSSPPPRR